MKARHGLMVLVTLTATYSSVCALNTPKDSDGPVRLLNCIVLPNSVLEAEVDNQSDDAQMCNLKCTFNLGGETFNHWFDVTIPKRYNGRVGHFDTNGAKAGNYEGEVGTCTKTSKY